ncbi:S8 family serine peptidase [Methanolobus sp. ZRKC2]|uniref:S8 family serine peptidase n=1 Tax=Methanolobus sp. ZRKC2 TaxID=3125783 RepID=UPI0032490F7D
MKSEKIVVFIFLFLLIIPQQALCEEGNNSTEGWTEDLFGNNNHLFEILEFVNTEKCHKICNLSGSNIKIGIWESSNNADDSSKVDDSRSELSGRIHIMDDHPVHSEHATKVALIIGSKTDDEADNGMAYDVEMYSYNLTRCYSEMIVSSVDISTNSYGNDDEKGNYTLGTQTSSQFYDKAIRDYNITCFKSAGNENNGEDYFTITPPGTAKNIITVGATEEDSFSDLADFSSFGPCIDGRLKPEIVAPGYNILLDLPGYEDTFEGTSYACPIASGSAALVLEKWKSNYPAEDMLPSTMKALLVHTANNDGNGPTYRYGYGMLDTKEAVDLVELDMTKNLTIVQDYSTFQNGTSQTTYDLGYVPDNIGEIKVTIAWSDKEGSNPFENYDLYNDLNLVISKDDGISNQYYYPWVLDSDNKKNSASSVNSSTYDPQSYGDHLNPLEQVQIRNPGAGNYSIIVDGAIDDGPQPYSLVVTVKPKIEVHSDKDGSKVYINNEDCYGLADGVIQDGVAEVCAYAGENSIMVEQDTWWFISWLFPTKLNIDCTVSESAEQRYYAYFDSYTLELKSGFQVISLPFAVSVSDVLPPAGGEVKKFDDGSFIAMNSSDILEKGHSYLVKSNAAATINLDAESNTFEKVDLAVGSHFIGAPAASCQVSDLLGDSDGKMVYKYNETNDEFVPVTSNETVSPGEALYICSMEASEVSV